MSPTPPPPVLSSARVVSYAFVDDIEYRQWGMLIVGDKVVERVPQLAIVVNLGKDIGPMLFHCDEDWEVLGTSGGETIQAVKERAEKNYPGVGARWVDVNTSVEEALRYYDEDTGGACCSFCRKRLFEIEDGFIEGEHATICRACVEEFHRNFTETDGREE